MNCQSLLIFLPVNYHHCHFLAATLNFTTFRRSILLVVTRFYSSAVFGSVTVQLAELYGTWFLGLCCKPIMSLDVCNNDPYFI